MDLREDLERDYGAAMERVELLRAQWDRQDRPLLARGSRGQPVPHALLRALMEAERHADHLRRGLLPPARMGRPAVAVPGPPSARLRALESERITRKS